jgi:hypothetical protein
LLLFTRWYWEWSETARVPPSMRQLVKASVPKFGTPRRVPLLVNHALSPR